MIYRIEINTTPENLDFSDYVVSLDSIPYKTNNRDKTIIFEGFSFRLSVACPYEIISGTRILFWRNETLIYIGLVDKTTFDEKAQTFYVRVNHVLSELKKRNTNLTRQSDGLGGYKTFIDLMLENTDEILIGSLSYDLILFRTTVELIINEAEDAGISIDWTNTNFYTESDFFWRCYLAGDTSEEIYTPLIGTSEYYFLAQQLNCSGVSGIYAPDEFTDDLNTEKPTLFDLLVQICVTLGLNFIPKDESSFYVVSIRSEMPSDYLSDEELFEIDIEDEIIEATGCEATYGTLDYSLWFNVGLNSIPEYDPGTNYYWGDHVTYNGQIYQAGWDGTYPPNFESNYFFGIDPDAVNAQYYWGLVSVDPEVSAYLEHVKSEDYFKQYEHRFGVNCENVEWMDNFNPIIVETPGTAYFAFPSVTVDNSCAKYLKRAQTDSYIKKKYVCPAEKIIDVSLYEFDSIYIDDIKSDTVEIEINERIV